MGATSSEAHYMGPRGLISRKEYIRLLEQALEQLGYPELSLQLQEESGIELQPASATLFREAILSGNYEHAIGLLPQLATDPASGHRAKFLIFRHKYIEAVAMGDTNAALHCLRNELQPLQNRTGGSEALQSLSAMLLTRSTSDCNSVPARDTLLAELQTLLPPSLLVPEGRLEELIEQALLAQLERCPYHNSRALNLSLFSDYMAGPEQLPTETSQVLNSHTDEVWVVQFSADGRWMATASKDGSALLWSVSAAGDVALHRELHHREAPGSLLAFSPDSKMVLIGGNDGKLRIFDVPGGSLIAEIARGGADGVSAAAWMPDSQRIATAGGGAHHELQIFSIDGYNSNMQRIPLEKHIYDMAISRDGGTCLVVGQDRCLRFLRIADQKEVTVGPEPAPVTCLATSPDGRFVAATMHNGVVHLWPMGDLTVPPAGFGEGPRPGGIDPLDALPAAPLQEYRSGEGQPGRFVIRSAFGGAGCAFIASGSESGQVHIWHRETGELLASLNGHNATVNAVSWHPRNQYLLASASDDGTVRIWKAAVTQGPLNDVSE